MRILSPESSRRMPWANGLGSTLEIATDASSSDNLDEWWSWRLSIADVPVRAAFSSFHGIDRWLACLRGDGMRIQQGGVWIDVPQSGNAIALKGEEQVFGDPIGAAVCDVNWFLRRDRWRGCMRVVRGDAMTDMTDMTNIDAQVVLVHVATGETQARISREGQSVLLAASCTLVTSGPIEIHCDAASVVVIAWANPK